MCVYIYTHIYTHTHIDIHIYMCVYKYICVVYTALIKSALFERIVGLVCFNFFLFLATTREIENTAVH